jgi:BirA family biotin operon repressor/biotin-[acetyl-CoA-carboxylase] ligase
MSNLDAEEIRKITAKSVGARLAKLEVFSEVDSTNSYLMQMPGPESGKMSIAVTDNQTAGRGRHGKTWQSPPGAGLCLSAAYTFARPPPNLPALTLALGLGVISALEELGAGNVKLKWPNDLVALDRKLGGILTEVQQQPADTLTVVTGIGVNLNLQHMLQFDGETSWSQRPVDLNQICSEAPRREQVAGKLITQLLRAFVEFEQAGFAPVAARWPDYDWLFGRNVTIDTANIQLSGVGAGIDEDGALLVNTSASGLQRVTSGTVVAASASGSPR